MDPIIIEPHSGGLGDMLLYSALPELYARAGRTVFISNRCVARNLETRDLVWERNPFISGFSDVGPTNRPSGFTKAAKRLRPGLRAMCAIHGFTTQLRYPQVYYVPRFRRDVADKVLADPASISQPMPPATFDLFVRNLATWHDFDPAKIIVLTSRFNPHHAALSACARYAVRDIFEYADMIFSCRAFICTESGGQSLASALKGERNAPKVFSLTTTALQNDCFFLYDNVDYYVTSGLSPSDYSGYLN